MKASEKRRPRLTPELAARVPELVGDYSLAPLPGDLRLASCADHHAIVADILAGAPKPDEVWVFAYGSLIWKPAFEFVEQRPVVLPGWHRRFCLGWDRRFRGSDEYPGLMLALDRGGSCHGMAYRLPPAELEKNLLSLARREMRVLPHPFPPRWVRLKRGEPPAQVLTFAIDRGSGRYVSGLTPEQIADALAKSIGELGSMAEYLCKTVVHLEALGIHDRQLWHLQELVADRIEAALADSG